MKFTALCRFICLAAFQHCVHVQNLSEFQNLATFQSTTAEIQFGVLLDFAAATLFGFKAGGQAVQLLNQTFDKKTSWPILLLLLLLHAFGEFEIKFNCCLNEQKMKGICFALKQVNLLCRRKTNTWKMVI